MADSDLRDRIAAILVPRRTNGLCPLDGPCDTCDCLDPQHRQERDDADAILAMLCEDPDVATVRGDRCGDECPRLFGEKAISCTLPKGHAAHRSAKDGTAWERLCDEVVQRAEQAEAAVERIWREIDPDLLDVLADWYEADDTHKRGLGIDVQADLRRWAKTIRSLGDQNA